MTLSNAEVPTMLAPRDKTGIHLKSDLFLTASCPESAPCLVTTWPVRFLRDIPGKRDSSPPQPLVQQAMIQQKESCTSSTVAYAVHQAQPDTSEMHLSCCTCDLSQVTTVTMMTMRLLISMYTPMKPEHKPLASKNHDISFGNH